MRNHVTFRCPEPFVPFSDEDGILSAKGVEWFATLLRRIPSLEIDPKFCQEDWGVVFFVTRNRKRFWIGLSMWPEGDGAWLAHTHHHSFAWLQRFTASGKDELRRLITDMHCQLSSYPRITKIAWYREGDMKTAAAVSTQRPDEE
jgi:hypothetical protein